jgi:hypothetical protein
MKVFGESFREPFGLVLRCDIVDRPPVPGPLASEGRLAALYNESFLRRLPMGETSNLPISAQLEEIFRAPGPPD